MINLLNKTDEIQKKVKIDCSSYKVDIFKKYLIEYNKEIEELKKDKKYAEIPCKSKFNNFLIKIGFNTSEDDKIEKNSGNSNIDLTIFNDKIPCVFFETKVIDSNEMITAKDINRKAFHELLFYYYRYMRNEDLDWKKTKFKYLIAFDFENMYIFKRDIFDELSKNEEIKKVYETWRNDNKNNGMKTDEVYSDYQKILKKIIKNEKIDVEYYYVNVTDLKDIDLLYKIFSKEFLIGEKEFNNVEKNVLNNSFYNELLYIFGLEEKKVENKYKIEMTNVENTFMDQLCKKIIGKKNMKFEEAKDIAMKIIIYWLNRILFIKLFEGQLVAYNNFDDSYRILTEEHIEEGFDWIHELFFDILGKKIDERKNKNEKIPYLNSSLFEIQKTESDYVDISDLKAEAKVSLMKGTVLKDLKVDDLGLLKYLIDFLNRYDFGIEKDNNSTQNGKDIINASVLGLVFEKINGYKDGAYFTPSIITEYMAKECVESKVVDIISKKYRKNKPFNDIREIISFIKSLDYEEKDKCKREIDSLINGLRICDPAVGSGHFLVSVLNRLIKIKYDLGIINCCRIELVNDTLEYYDNDKKIVYSKTDKNSNDVYKELFNEKKKIIENCLFGVDINRNTVEICKLRLWIELLKNAYYINDIEMETLPNIDINIKCGDSLINEYEYQIGQRLKADKSYTEKKRLEDMKKYMAAVNYYKNKIYKSDLTTFVDNAKDKMREYIAKIKVEIKNKLEIPLQLDSFQNVALYENTMEWGLEFPEVLDDYGKFNGFDIIIGNPPYGVKLSDDIKKLLNDKYSDIHKRTTDTYMYFISLGFRLLKEEGILCYITPNNVLYQAETVKVRELMILENKGMTFINLGDNVFENANVPTCILECKKTKELANYAMKYDDFRENKNEYFDFNKTFNTLELDDIKIFEDYIIGIDANSLNVIKTMTPKSIKLDDIAEEVSSGISTGGNKAFVINDKEAQKKQLESNKLYKVLCGSDISQYSISYDDLDVIYITKKDDISKYPFIGKHLAKFKNDLSTRSEFKGKPYWFALSRERDKNIFESNKIIIRQTGDSIIAAYDNNKYYSIDTTNILTLKQGWDTEDDYLFVLGVLNSTLTNSVYQVISQESGRTLAQVKPQNLRKLFIPSKMSKIDKGAIVGLVKNIMANQSLKDENQNKIDEILKTYYGL